MYPLPNLPGLLCKNMPEILFSDQKLQQELETVRRYFNLTDRATPVPYFTQTRIQFAEQQILRKMEQASPESSLSIYLHIPFCDGKCHFCDLYSFHVPQRNIHIIGAYIQMLEKEIEWWGHRFSWQQRPVTTVHFGGGSPLVSNHSQIERLFNSLKRYFRITPATEIAVEITTSQINDETLRICEDLHIKRIHIGVQTLDDSQRQLLGRRENSHQVIEKIKRLVTEDFVNSVDILYGLPGQSFNQLENDLRALIDLGIDGFALYELQTTRAFEKHLIKTAKQLPEKLERYHLFVAAKQFLNQTGYSNVFFNHFGNHRDRNLYFTYPDRGEDCLGLGAIADGFLNGVFYRHLKYKPYLNAIQKGDFGLENGYAADAAYSGLYAFEAQLMSTQITSTAIEAMEAEFGPRFRGIFDLWRYAGIIREGKPTGIFELTGSGCWLLASLMGQLRRLMG